MSSTEKPDYRDYAHDTLLGAVMALEDDEVAIAQAQALIATAYAVLEVAAAIREAVQS